MKSIVRPMVAELTFSRAYGLKGSGWPAQTVVKKGRGLLIMTRTRFLEGPLSPLAGFRQQR